MQSAALKHWNSLLHTKKLAILDVFSLMRADLLFFL